MGDRKLFMEDNISFLILFLILVFAVCLVLYKLKDGLDGLKDGGGKVPGFARDGIFGMAIVGAIGLLLLWLGIEALFLVGPRIFDGQMMVGQPVPFTVTSPGETWVFTIGPTGKSRKELQYRIMAPGEELVFSGKDRFEKGIRRFEYTPLVSGQHILVVNYTFSGNFTKLGWLRINRDDNAFILRKFGHLWPIKLGVWSPFYPRDQIPGWQMDQGGSS